MDATDSVVDAFEYFMKYKRKHRDYQINPTVHNVTRGNFILI